MVKLVTVDWCLVYQPNQKRRGGDLAMPAPRGHVLSSIQDQRIKGEGTGPCPLRAGMSYRPFKIRAFEGVCFAVSVIRSHEERYFWVFG